jgi:hypothetical protein
LHDRFVSRSACRDRGFSRDPDGHRLDGAAAHRQFRLQLHISGAEYWIIRWSLSPGGALRRRGGG